LDTCCSTPIADYFLKEQKTGCNAGKTDTALFKITNEYVLNKYQNYLNNKVDLRTNGNILQSAPDMFLTNDHFSE